MTKGEDYFNRSVAERYGKAIVHMRQRHFEQRFGLIFGSGIGVQFGFPQWNDLVERIARDPRVDGTKLLRKLSHAPAQCQSLFQLFKGTQLRSKRNAPRLPDMEHAQVMSEWYEVVHDALYKRVPTGVNQLQKKGDYLLQYLPIIRRAPLTVTYNFDDTLEQLLRHDATASADPNRKGFRTIWDADAQLHADRGIVYHPNGFMPRNFVSNFSDELVFLEDSFGDQLIDSSTGRYLPLVNHLAQNTCLLIGLSLEDATLKHLLRRTSKSHPGHVHYFVRFLSKSGELDDDSKINMRDANFEVHNLVTLFLTSAEISALGRLLTMQENEFEPLLNDLAVPRSYKFYLTGSVAVGKTSSVSHFRSLGSHDEWVDVRAKGMDLDPEEIRSKKTVKEIDTFVAEQWKKKNYDLSSTGNKGIHIVDRSPLDAFAFTKKTDWSAKANFLKGLIFPNKSKKKLCSGMIVLMKGDPSVMSARALQVHKKFGADRLTEMQGRLMEIFPETTGIVHLETRNRTVKQVVKELCRMIHMGEYMDYDLHAKLLSLAKSKRSAGKVRKPRRQPTKGPARIKSVARRVKRK